MSLGYRNYRYTMVMIGTLYSSKGTQWLSGRSTITLICIIIAAIINIFAPLTETCQNGAIQGITFDVHCSFNRTTVPCNGPIRSGTIATVTCAIGYKKPDRTVFDTLVCGTHGEWDYHPHSCVPICGQEVVEVKPFASNADPVDITKVPWHAAIYQRGNDGIKHICGGTIISAKLVISGKWIKGQKLRISRTFIISFQPLTVSGQKGLIRRNT